MRGGLLVDLDAHLINAMENLLHRPQELACALTRLAHLDPSPELVWRHAKALRAEPSIQGAAAWWLWTAGARGGIGDFKGAHKLRPSVDGFIPNRAALIERVSTFPPLPQIELRHGRAEDVEPISGAVVVLDAPYLGTQGYGAAPCPHPDSVLFLANRWHEAGATVGVCYGTPLQHPRWAVLDLTGERRGQHRRSLTRSVGEYLMVPR